MDLSQFSQNQEIDIDAERLIASGGTSLCYCVKLYGKLHFLKRLKPEFRSNPRYVAAMRKEFETGYNLNHPHLVRYVACGDDYLLTEWIDGVTLKDFTEQNPKFFKSHDNVQRLVGELLDVVDYLHTHQVVHLDLKPSNILITRVGNEVKLTDLGFCYTDTFADADPDLPCVPMRLADGTPAWPIYDAAAGTGRCTEYITYAAPDGPTEDYFLVLSNQSTHLDDGLAAWLAERVYSID